MEKCSKEQCPYWVMEKEVYITYDNRTIERDLSQCVYHSRKEKEQKKRGCEGDDICPCDVV